MSVGVIGCKVPAAGAEPRRGPPEVRCRWMTDPSQRQNLGEDFLSRYAGWLLILLGCGAMALSVIVIDHEAVASIFALTGVASAVLGIVVSRAEGPIELGPSGLKATLTSLSTVARSEELTLEDKGEILAATLSEAGPQVINVGGIASSVAVGKPVVSGAGVAAGPHPSAFEKEVIARFIADGWEVEPAGLGDMGFDFKARRGSELLLVEVKARRRLSTADMRRILGHLVPAAKEAGAIPVIAVPDSSVTAAAMQALADTGVRLMQVPSGK